MAGIKQMDSGLIPLKTPRIEVQCKRDLQKLKTAGLRALSMSVIYLLFLPVAAWGHAFPDRSDPKVGATVSGPVTSVRIWFDSDLEPLFSRIVVKDSGGRQADKGDFSIREINDWFHLLGAEAWLGGLLALSALVFPRITTLPRQKETEDPDSETRLIAGIARRFSAMAGVAVAVMIITSALNYVYYIGGEKALLGTPYGLTALAKIVFVAALLNLGAFNRYVSVPALERWAGLDCLPANRASPAGRPPVYTRRLRPGARATGWPFFSNAR